MPKYTKQNKVTIALKVWSIEARKFQLGCQTCKPALYNGLNEIPIVLGNDSEPNIGYGMYKVVKSNRLYI